MRSQLDANGIIVFQSTAQNSALQMGKAYYNTQIVRKPTTSMINKIVYGTLVMVLHKYIHSTTRPGCLYTRLIPECNI